MKNLLHIIDSLALGGAERLLVDTLNALPGYHHHVIILHGPESLKAELKDGIPVLNLQQTSHKQLLFKARMVRRYIREKNISLVHSHLYFSSILSRLATPKKIPLVNTLHVISSLDNYTKNKLSLYLEKITYRKHHNVIAVSHEVLNDFDKWVGLKSPNLVLYNFIKDEYFQANPHKYVPGSPLTLVAVGNLRYQKNYPFLIEAFKNMPANVSLDIYGDGPLRAQLEQEIARHKLNVRLMGARPEMHKRLLEYDAFVMSSFFEGQPLALLEAIASGLPAILCNIPVLREVTGDHAVYFDAGDPADLVAKVKDIVSGHIDLSLHTSAARARIEGYAKKHIYIQKVNDLYKGLLNTGQLPSVSINK